MAVMESSSREPQEPLGVYGSLRHTHGPFSREQDSLSFWRKKWALWGTCLKKIKKKYESDLKRYLDIFSFLEQFSLK